MQTGYLKAEISNCTGSPSVWIAFVGSNPGNNSHCASINTSILLIGTHTITASVTESGSLPGSDSIMVTVTPGGTLDPVADHIDGVNLIPFVNGTAPASPP